MAINSEMNVDNTDVVQRLEKHLELIQGVINRLCSSSFQVKSWAITIVSGLIGLLVGIGKYHYIGLSIFPTMLFWGLDAYFLMQERKFRALYEDVVKVINNQEPSYPITAFAMTYNNYVSDKNKHNSKQFLYFSSFISTTLFLLYGLITTMIFVIMAVLINEILEKITLCIISLLLLILIFSFVCHKNNKKHH